MNKNGGVSFAIKKNMGCCHLLNVKMVDYLTPNEVFGQAANGTFLGWVWPIHSQYKKGSTIVCVSDK